MNRDFGSLQNLQYGNMDSPTPEVGMGATYIGYTDRHAYTVIEVVNPKCIVVQQDTARRTDKNGMSDSQSWEFERNPNGRRVTLTLRKNGDWRETGTRSGGTFLIGERMEYYDYSF